jgi:hypothetical protein
MIASGITRGMLNVYRDYSDILYLVPQIYQTTAFPQMNVIGKPTDNDNLAEASGSVFVGGNILNTTANYVDSIPTGLYTCVGWRIDLKHLCTAGTSRYVQPLGSIASATNNWGCKCFSTDTYNPALCPTSDISATSNVFIDAQFTTGALNFTGSSCVLDSTTISDKVTLSVGIIQLSKSTQVVSCASNPTSPSISPISSITSFTSSLPFSTFSTVSSITQS